MSWMEGGLQTFFGSALQLHITAIPFREEAGSAPEPEWREKLLGLPETEPIPWLSSLQEFSYPGYITVAAYNSHGWELSDRMRL
jgi:hypothetical protein